MMKKVSSLLLLLAFLQTFSQETESKYPQDKNKTHEVKLSTTSLIILSSLDVSYEYLVNKDSSFGVSLFYNFDEEDTDLYYPRQFSVTPYYRWFFSESRFARGFFVEGFGMLNTYRDEIYYDYYDDDGYSSSYDDKQQTNFALGISVGGKFITKPGFVAEVFLGVGRNLFGNDNTFTDNEIVARGGISLGYRF